MAVKGNAVKYGKSSPWYNTRQNRLYLDLITIRPVPAQKDDFRYAIDANKLNNLGWNKTTNFNEGIKKTIEWYMNNDKKIIYF
jgi:dTDP-D-glucose 4,6-dehydratase